MNDSGVKSIQELIRETDPDLLQFSVQACLKVLQDIKKALGTYASVSGTSSQVTQWLETIHALEESAQSPYEEYYGIFGATGAGKSSATCATVDEDRLLPSNPMRACTSVITELRFNESDGPDKRYRAEVEFITVREWHDELERLLKDIQDKDDEDQSKRQGDDAKAEEEAQIALAKVRAVYPTRTEKSLAHATVDALIGEGTVRRYLGTTKILHSAKLENFRQELKEFIDSKDKGRKGTSSEIWPLIKVVRIYIRAQILSKGVVLVDLPGSGDTNAARSTVAEGYKEKCKGFWVVAPIVRATDDQGAHNLMDDFLRHQLQFYGTYSNITFICSKSDDFTADEWIENMPEEDTEVNQAISVFDALRQRNNELTQRLQVVDTQIADLVRVIKGHDSERRLKRKTQHKLNGGSESGLQPKRPKTCTGSAPLVRTETIQAINDGSIFHFGAASALAHDTPGNSSHATPAEQSQAVQELEMAILEIGAKRKAANEQKKELEKVHDILVQENQKQQTGINKAERKLGALCIVHRNRLSKRDIRARFGAETKRQAEIYIKTEGEAGVPKREPIDEAAAASELPVFCVSSRAYQQLMRTPSGHPSLPYFWNLAQTEIPLLQSHCASLTDVGRTTKYCTILNAVDGLIISIQMTCDLDLAKTKQTAARREEEARFLMDILDETKKRFYATLSEAEPALEAIFKRNITDIFPTAVAYAKKQVLKVARALDDKDIKYQTYKAICRHGGIHVTNKRQKFNVNREIMKVITQLFVQGWKQAFEYDMPQLLRQLVASLQGHIHHLQNIMEARAKDSESGIVSNIMLSRQISIWVNECKEIQTLGYEFMNQEKKKISRKFEPAFRASMQSTYDECLEIKGKLALARMKAHMAEGVDTRKDTMFDSFAAEVTQQLLTMQTSSIQKMLRKSNMIVDQMETNFSNAIGSSKLVASNSTLESNSEFREKISTCLIAVEAEFLKTCNAEKEVRLAKVTAVKDNVYNSEVDGECETNSEYDDDD